MYNLYYICNALDDATRLERDIVTDSPAASRKVFQLSKALRKAGTRVYIISLGRGKQDGSGRYFSGKVKRIDGVIVIYLPFFHYPILSELLTLFSSIPILWRVNKNKVKSTALFYNRVTAYFPILIFSKILNIPRVLDLEDGTVGANRLSLSNAKSSFYNWIFDSLCSAGALLACEALGEATKLRPTQCCYGVSEITSTSVDWYNSPVMILFGGTISNDTGAPLLINVINKLRDTSPLWAKSLTFNITGKGDCLEQFKAFSEGAAIPKVVVYGRTTDDEYRKILSDTHVGLALKPNVGLLAQTTFPSKVIEFSSLGILVLTTDISDVRKVLNNGAVYLEVDDPDILIEKLKWIVENREAAKVISNNGNKSVSVSCSPKSVGQMLKTFLFHYEG